jgi:hypothetical protein
LRRLDSSERNSGNMHATPIVPAAALSFGDPKIAG